MSAGDIDDSTNTTADDAFGGDFFVDDEEEQEKEVNTKQPPTKPKLTKKQSSKKTEANDEKKKSKPQASQKISTITNKAEGKDLSEEDEEPSTTQTTTDTKKDKKEKKKKTRKKVSVEELPPISEADKVGHLKAIHRAVKKAQKLAIAKVTRKRKEESSTTNTTSSLEQDLQLYRALDIDALSSQAWSLYELKQKPVFSESLVGRARELAQLLLHSPSVKSAFEEMTQKRIKEHQHKQYLKNKKKLTKEEAKATAGATEKVDAKLLERLYKLREGEVVQGIVDGVEPFGVFVDFWAKKQRYRGLVHISEVTGEKIDQLNDYFDVGDPVRAVVLKIDKDTLRVSLTLKKKYFPEGDPGWVVASRRFQKSDGKVVSANFSSPSSSSSSKSDNNNSATSNNESTFVTSLKASAPISELTEKKRKKTQLVKLMEMAKGVSKKRMGQRQRQELLTELYGEAGEQPKKPKPAKKERDPNEGPVTPRTPFKPLGRAEQKRRKRLRESGELAPLPDNAEKKTQIPSSSASLTSPSSSLASSSIPSTSTTPNKDDTTRAKRQKTAPKQKDPPKPQTPQGGSRGAAANLRSRQGWPPESHPPSGEKSTKTRHRESHSQTQGRIKYDEYHFFARAGLAALQSP